MAELIDIALAVNGEPRRLRVRSDRRLLDLLREDLRLTGAKEGCGKGECGSCTVLLDGRAVDACLLMAWQADGGAVDTIEGLGGDGTLDPVQRAFVEKGAVQCGACIPGMVLAGKALLDRVVKPSADDVRRGLAGNLCRCTGYAKPVAAVLQAAAERSPRRPTVSEPAAPSYYRPRSLEEALEILVQRSGEVRALAGGTDLLVQAKDGLADRGAFFDLGLVPELQGIDERDDHVRVGALVTHAQAADSTVLARWCPALPPACAQVGGPQVRNRGTLGGNLAQGAPSGDAIPPLFAADARLEVVSVSNRREVPIEDFFTGPGRTVLAPDELIVSIQVPKRPGVRASFERLAQRRGPSVAKISLAVAMTFKDGRPSWVRVALGAVGPTVVRMKETEEALMAGGYDALQRAVEAVRNEARAADDLRSTREYRRAMAAVLLQRGIQKLMEG